MPRRSCCRLVATLALLLAIPWGLSIVLAGTAHARASAAENASGAPPEWKPAPRVVAPAPAGLDDLLQPVREDPAPVPVPPPAFDLGVLQPLEGVPVALWERLAKLDPARRSDATIEIEPGPRPTAAALESAANVRQSWDSGDHEGAIAALRAFEESGGRCALGIGWKPGTAPASVENGGDVRVGGIRTNAQNVSLDFHAATGNLFCVVRWGSTTGTSSWTVNVSLDDGATWTETYDFASSVGLVDASSAVVGNFLYVGYIVGNATSGFRLRRFNAVTGASDGAYGFRVVLDATPAAFKEVAVATNADDFNNRVFCFGLQDDGALRFAWDLSTDGTTFTEASPAGVTDASFGLDATWNCDYVCDRFLFVSYVGTDALIHVRAFDDPGWTGWTPATANGITRPTSISARASTVICAYEEQLAEGVGIRYRISYDCGETWNVGILATPDGVTIHGYQAPEVDARDANGTAMVYTAEAGEPDAAYYQVRRGYAPGPWENPVQFNEHDVVTGGRTAIAHLPRLAPAIHSHGAVYLGPSLVPYFDYPGPGEVDVPLSMPGGERLALQIACRNPMPEAARLELVVPRAAPVEVGVYDVRGALVRTLAGGTFEPGRHRLDWDGLGRDGRPAGAGVFFVRATSPLGEASVKLARLGAR